MIFSGIIKAEIISGFSTPFWIDTTKPSLFKWFFTCFAASTVSFDLTHINTASYKPINSLTAFTFRL